MTIQDQDRGLSRVAVPIGPGGTLEELYAGSFALVVGVHHYDNPAAWAPLESVPRELQTIVASLQRAGFESVEYVDNPGGQELRGRIEAFIGAHGYDRRSRLVFFFAGHGHTMDNGDRGYFVPRDAPDPTLDEVGFRRLALPMNQVATWAEDITALHALFAFDSCFSGTIFRTRGDTYPQRLSDSTAKPVRQFLSSGSAGERVPATSIFVPLFVKGLAGDADLDGDSFVTGTELGNYIQREVLERRARQTPQFGRLHNLNLDEGDIVFATTRSRRPPSTGAGSAMTTSLRPTRVAATPTELPIVSLSASPDGRSLAYVDPRGIHVRTSDGAARVLPDSAGLRSVVWSRDSASVLALDTKGKSPARLWAFSPTGDRKPLTSEEGPNRSPDGTMGFEFVLDHSDNSSKRPVARVEDLRNHTFKELFTVQWPYLSMAWSPESSYMLAVASGDRGFDVFTVDPSSGHRAPVTTIESTGYNPTTNAPGVFVPDTVLVLSGGRIVYSTPEAPPNQLDDNLWLARVNPKTGVPLTEPQRLTSWIGFHIAALTAGRDGKELFFLTSSTQSDVAVGRLLDGGAKLEDVRRLTLDNRNDVPFAWTPDSRQVIFVSDRNGTNDIFAQRLDEDSPEELVGGPDDESLPRVSPDGKYLFYAVTYEGGWRLMRATLAGRERQTLLDSTGFLFHGCGTQGGCFLREYEGDHLDLKISDLDPQNGRGTKLFTVTFPHQFNTAMSWDSSQFAVPRIDVGPPPTVPSIAVMTRRGDVVRDVPLPQGILVTSLEWNIDKTGFFVGAMSNSDDADGYESSQLGYLSMTGDWHLLYRPALWGIPSPDGKWLAIHVPNRESNIWKVPLPESEK